MQKEIAELKKIPGLHHRCTSSSPPNFNHLPTALVDIDAYPNLVSKCFNCVNVF